MTDYRVWYSTDNVDYSVLATSVSETTYAAQGLTTGTSYYFKVQAHNIIGYSEFSNIVQDLAAQEPSKPDIPITSWSN